ncbi:MAG: NADH-quinone oxidoreductase subunit NuoE [Verrucomicrobiota bacterium]
MQSNDQETIQQIFSGYQGRRNELIPILQDVQEAFGYVPREAMTKIAHFLNIPESSVYGVVTFYAQFYRTRQGKHKIRVCQGTACHVRGGRRIMQAVEKKLGINPGETTADYKFSLERVACFGSCALAPVMVVDGKVYGRITPQKAEKILESLN